MREIAEWLVYAYQQGVRLSGIVYLHSISENRVKGSGITNLEMFKKITGIDNMSQVVLATTMWNCTPEADAKGRELELLQTDEFWGLLVRDHSSTPGRFLNDKTSALGIIDKLASLQTFVPSLQQEIAVDKKQLNDTAAGQTLNKELIEAQKKSARELKQIEQELNTALHNKDVEYAQKVLDMQTGVNKQMEQLAQNQKDMQVKSEELLKNKEEEIQKTREEMAEIQRKMTEQNQKHAADVAQIKEESRRQEEETKKVMDDLERNNANNMERFKDRVVDSAAYLVSEMDQYYNSIANKQQAKVEEAVNQLKAQGSGPPPPYSAAGPPPMQPPYIHPPPMPQANPYEDMVVRGAGMAAGAAAGSTAVGLAAATGVCILM